MDNGDDVELLLDKGLLHLHTHLQVRVLPAGGLQVKPKKFIKKVLRQFEDFFSVAEPLRMAKVPEQTLAPAPTYLGRLRLQATIGGSGSGSKD